MANNSKVKTFISDYSICWIIDTTRHILINSSYCDDRGIGLCGAGNLSLSSFNLTEKDFIIHSRIYKSLCPKCLNKMPKELVEELKYNYIVKKLKS